MKLKFIFGGNISFKEFSTIFLVFYIFFCVDVVEESFPFGLKMQSVHEIKVKSTLLYEGLLMKEVLISVLKIFNSIHRKSLNQILLHFKCFQFPQSYLKFTQAEEDPKTVKEITKQNFTFQRKSPK